MTQDCDLKLSGGAVIDGTGSPATIADVALGGGRITAVGDLSELEARETLDCRGKTIVPGFIDIHSHADWLLGQPDHGRLVEPFLRQGITSVVGGNCGFSPAPVGDGNRGSMGETSRLIVDDAIELRWQSMADYLDEIERVGPALNLAELVGHGSVRAAVSGALSSRAPSSDELAEMERLSKQALDAGCAGISTGLGYPPGIFAGHEELAAFASWAAARDKLFTSHVKAYSWASGAYQSDPGELAHNLLAIDEIIQAAQAAEARLQISHLIFVGRNSWPTHTDAIERIERARGAGLDVAFDAFPYTAGNTTASVIFPPELLPRLEEVLANPDEMEPLRAFGDAVFEQIGFHLRDIQIMRANAPALDRYDGMFVDRAAEAAEMDIWDFYARLVVDSKRNARVLIHRYSGEPQDESALEAVLAHPLCTIETDTFLTARGHQNPASYGTFPRVLATYVKRGLFSFEEAVAKMTGKAAERLCLKDRGWLRPGCAADLVVLDRGRLADTASFEHPASFPSGIDDVFVNGQRVIAGTRYDENARAGRVLRF